MGMITHKQTPSWVSALGIAFVGATLLITIGTVPTCGDYYKTNDAVSAHRELSSETSALRTLTDFRFRTLEEGMAEMRSDVKEIRRMLEVSTRGRSR
jgi:hypothetical protein